MTAKKKKILTSTSLVTKYLDERLSWLSFMVLFRGENQTWNITSLRFLHNDF